MKRILHWPVIGSRVAPSPQYYCDKRGAEIKGVPTVEPGRREHWPDIGGQQREQSVLQSVTQ